MHGESTQYISWIGFHQHFASWAGATNPAIMAIVTLLFWWCQLAVMYRKHLVCETLNSGAPRAGLVSKNSRLMVHV
jgi:predicted acyltransferase